MAKPKQVATDILNVIKRENIRSFTNCMTRLRIKANPNFDQEALKKIDGVLGLVLAGSDEFQIVLGPGFVNKVADEFSKLVNLEGEQLDLVVDQDLSAAQIAKLEKAKLKNKGNQKVKGFLAKISKVFTPLIPAFIGAGLLAGIGGIISSSTTDQTGKSWATILSFALPILTNVFIIIVGWRLAKEFNGNAGLSALVAAMFCGFAGTSIVAVFIPITIEVEGEKIVTSYNFLGMIIDKADLSKKWFTVGFVNLNATGEEVLGAPHSGLIGSMIAVGFTIFIEKNLRKVMPGVLDTLITPIIVILIMLGLNFVLIIPLAGYLFTGITWFFNNLYTNPFGAAFLAGIFLFALALGVHQGFLPIYFALIQTTGVNGLFPIMTMAGVGQVGVAIGMWFLAGKGSTLRKQISGAIIPGFLGIGEPLIYGISLPRVKPFFMSCLAAAFGGFMMGALNSWAGLGIGMNAATGPGGLTATIMMTTTNGDVVMGILVYLAVVFTTYFIGAGICFFGYSKVARYGVEVSKTIFNNCQLAWKTNNGQTKALTTLLVVGMILNYLTLIGLVISWTIGYQRLEQEQKVNYQQFQLV